ncbi:MAG: hypothetical protein MJ246_00910 [Clostridia bacterium]|nr:hypothetical protein [Clostridia bacterium]
MKKILIIALILTLSLSITACDNTKDNESIEVQEENSKTAKGIGYEEIIQNESGVEVKRKQLNPIVDMRPDKNKEYDVEKMTEIIEKRIEEENPGVSSIKILQDLTTAGFSSAIQMGQKLVDEYGEDFVYNEVDYYGVYVYVYYHDKDTSIIDNSNSYKELVETAYADEKVYNLVKFAFDNYDNY